jgi:hypothetical protein
MESLEDTVQEAVRVIDGAAAAGLVVRAIGGVAIVLHAKSDVHPALRRPCGDIDLVTEKRQGRAVLKFLSGLGYESNGPFNAQHGDTRLIVYDVARQRQVDVFVGEFRMCHRIPMATRLRLEPRTLPLAELLLTKLQVVRMNRKDVSDILAILLDHPVGEGDDETVNGAHIASLLSTDWGLWRTCQASLETVIQTVGDFSLEEIERALLVERLRQIGERVESEPKSVTWRMRARLGDRVQWYEDPDEVETGNTGIRSAPDNNAKESGL